jgi:hypothetical protein
MSPSGCVDAGIAGLRRTGRGRLIVDTLHDLHDADRLVAGRYTESLQLRTGQIRIGTGTIKNKLDEHIEVIASGRHIDFIVLALLCLRLRNTGARK